MTAISYKKDDRLFSWYIRERDNWTCQRCLKRYPRGAQGLHAAHFRGRGKGSTKYDPLNADALCAWCHKYFHDNQREHEDWKRRRLGDNLLDALILRSNIPSQRTREANLLWLRLETSRLGIDRLIKEQRA